MDLWCYACYVISVEQHDNELRCSISPTTVDGKFKLYKAVKN